MENVLYPVMYLPSEVHNRDWDARLLIADHATAAGYTCVVGQQWVLNENIARLPRGLVLFKTINNIQLGIARAWKEAGHVIACMDEEVFAFAPERNHIHVLPKDLAEVCDVFLANNPLHASTMVRKLPALKGKTFAVGNARLDLLSGYGRRRYAAEADTIRRKFGPFVLFNSNIAQDNSIWENKQEYLQIQIRAGAVDPEDPASVERYRQQFEFERSNSQAFMAALGWCLERLTSHRVVVRPHPVERPEFWEEIAREHKNLHVARDTRHAPWMMAADAIVHTSSTTGLEAMVLDKPVVNLLPNPDGFWEDIFITRYVNHSYADWKDGMESLEEYLAAGTGRLAHSAVKRDEVSRYFPNIGSAAHATARRLMWTMMEREMLITDAPFNFMHQVVGRGNLPRVHRSPAVLRKFSKSMPAALEDLRDTRLATGLRHPIGLFPLAPDCYAIVPGAKP